MRNVRAEVEKLEVHEYHRFFKVSGVRCRKQLVFEHGES